MYVPVSDLEPNFPSDSRPPFVKPPSSFNGSTGEGPAEPPLFEGTVGTTVELPCTPPRGTPAPVVQWKRNGIVFDPLALGNRNRLVINSSGHLRYPRKLTLFLYG